MRGMPPWVNPLEWAAAVVRNLQAQYPTGVGSRQQEIDPLICSGGLNSVVSFVVILLQFPVDLRGPSHNTDAQNIA